MINKKTVLALLFILLVVKVYAQEKQIKGVVLDKENKAPLFAVNLLLVNSKDSTDKRFASTDFDGHFLFAKLNGSSYVLTISYMGYHTTRLNVTAGETTQDPGVILLSTSLKQLNEIVVTGKAVSSVQKGDTSQFNANSFKTNPDANAEDLISKMPGITSNNGVVKVNGEDVKQVLVDGKVFFGDDANMALKNLPADVIDKIQVFDKLSDQAQFTGFDDGQSNKTINIVTKPGKANGQFGKIYSGYGENDRYISGGNINLFKGERRISVVGLSNNINQQNFTSQDLTGISGSSGGSRGGRGRRSGGGGSDVNNFLVGNQGGITTTHAAGINYSDKWGDKIKIAGSYFFNQSDNDNLTSLNRNYFSAADSGLFYNESSRSGSEKDNHRFNIRFEYTIDSSNSIIFTPKGNLQGSSSMAHVLGNSLRSETILQSRTDNNNNLDGSGYSSSNNLLFRHKFKKKGRTFSINLGGELNKNTGNGNLYSVNEYDQLLSNTILHQQSDQVTNGYTLSSGLTYTEPLDSSSQLQFSYHPAFTKNNIDKQTNNIDILGNYSLLDTALSNIFESNYFSNNVGISYRLRGTKYNFMARVNYQHAILKGSQVYPDLFAVEKSFINILPHVMYNYKMTPAKNLRIIYRTSTNAPSVSQLQHVIDNRNPILLSTGNPDLKQNYGHTFITRYGNTNSEKSTGLFVFLYANYTQDYIGNSTFIARADTTLDGILLKRGSQLSKPVNLDGFYNARSFLTYALPIGMIKSNMNFNTGFTFNRIPASINAVINLANNYNISQGVGLSSNTSEKIDFNLSYTGNYSIVKNTLQKGSDNNYFYQTTSFKFNCIIRKGWVLNTSLDHTLYTGLSSSFNQNYLLWNASLGYKFFKDRSLELKGSVFDILNQNNSINRTVTETYIEDNRTNILNQYFMLTLTYNLKAFKSAPGNR